MYNDIKDNDIIKYLINNDIYFISILNEFNNNYSIIPNNINFYPFMKGNSIDSLIGYTSNGHFYLKVNDEYIDETVKFLNKKLSMIFSIYGRSELIHSIISNLKLKPKNIIDYNFMIINKENFNYNNIIEPENFQCIKCNEKHFESLKKLQYLYHKEEVYDENSYYPYFAEMNSFKELLKKKLVYAVYVKNINEKKQIAVSKANVNGETPYLYQLGGIFTKKEYRGLKLSTLCLNTMINDIFNNYGKDKVALFVKKNNTPAINLYKKIGFNILFSTTLCYF
jgi:RimJ/RimL family protein N-acetyltransferase